MQTTQTVAKDEKTIKTPPVMALHGEAGRLKFPCLLKEERPHKPPVHCQVKRQIQPKSEDQVQKH